MFNILFSAIEARLAGRTRDIFYNSRLSGTRFCQHSRAGKVLGMSVLERSQRFWHSADKSERLSNDLRWRASFNVRSSEIRWLSNSCKGLRVWPDLKVRFGGRGGGRFQMPGSMSSWSSMTTSITSKCCHLLRRAVVRWSGEVEWWGGESIKLGFVHLNKFTWQMFSLARAYCKLSGWVFL